MVGICVVTCFVTVQWCPHITLVINLYVRKLLCYIVTYCLFYCIYFYNFSQYVFGGNLQYYTFQHACSVYSCQFLWRFCTQTGDSFCKIIYLKQVKTITRWFLKLSVIAYMYFTCIGRTAVSVKSTGDIVVMSLFVIYFNLNSHVCWSLNKTPFQLKILFVCHM